MLLTARADPTTRLPILQAIQNSRTSSRHLVNTQTSEQDQTIDMAEHNYKFNVTMTCGGCSGAVERVLKKLDGMIHDTHRATPACALTVCRRCQVLRRVSRHANRHRQDRGERRLCDRPRKDQEDRQEGQLRRGGWCGPERMSIRGCMTRSSTALGTCLRTVLKSACAGKRTTYLLHEVT